MVKNYAQISGAASVAMAFFFATAAWGQSQNQTLTELERAFLREDSIQKQLVAAYAAEQGIQTRMELEDGTIVELMRIENGTPIYNTTFNTQGGQLIKASRVYPGGGAGLSLTGAGITLGIWDGGGTRTTHQEFNNGGVARVTQRDNPNGLSSHATHVAGTMVAGGVRAQGNTRGMSYAARLDAHDWGADIAEMTSRAANGLQASQHSYGNISGWANGNYSGVNGWHWFGDVSLSQTTDYRFGFYDNTARSWDLLINNAPYYLPVKSAGNDRGQGPTAGASHRARVNGTWQTLTTVRDRDGGTSGYDCVIDAGNSKNTLTVGAVTSTGSMSTFSGWGPTDDGRVKPDIVAKGVSVVSSSSASNTSYSTSSGTSMSGPMVSGAIGLLLQHNQNLYPGTRMLSSTIKALVLHTANDRVAGSTPGPDYRNGWGLMDVEKAALLQSADKNFNKLHIHELDLAQGDTLYIPIKAAPGQPLRATIAWNDPAGFVTAPALNDRTPKLINDLDLRIFDAQAQESAPYVLNPDLPALPATTGDNFRDNVEMVHLTTPVPGGDYLLRIAHKGSLQGGTQKVSLIVSGNQRNDVLALADLISPNGTLYVIGEVRAEAPVHVANLVIPEQQQLTITPNQYIIAANAAQLDGQLILASNAAGYAQAQFPSNTTGSGILTQQQFAATAGWYTMGASAMGGNLSQFGNVVNTPGSENLLLWNAQTGIWEAGASNQAITTGVGYQGLVGPTGVQQAPATFEASGTPVLNWTPTIFNANFDGGVMDLSDAQTRSGWNLLANPFAASLDFTTLPAEQFQNLEQAFYTYNPRRGLMGGYDAYGPAGSPNDRSAFIAPMQGFWLRAMGSGPYLNSLSYQNTTVLQSPVFAKTNNITDHLELQLRDGTSTTADWFTLAFTTDATDAFDNGWDARKLQPIEAAAPSFFSIGNTDYLAINAIDYGSHRMGEKVVPLGLMATTVGERYSIALNDAWLDNLYEVFLEDQHLNIFHDLRTAAYDFEAVANSDFRFRLRLGNGTSAAQAGAVDGWIFDRTLRIRSNGYEGPLAWRLYDIAGKVVLHNEAATTITAQQTLEIAAANLATGIYMLVLEGPGAPISIKVQKF